MHLYIGETSAVKAAIRDAAAKAEAEGKKTGIIDFDGDTGSAARLFFKELRGYDSQGVDLILAAGVKEEGIGVAVMHRMRNAAGENIFNV
jgi:L-threonylcarbamoyladenylate synthase